MKKWITKGHRIRVVISQSGNSDAVSTTHDGSLCWSCNNINIIIFFHDLLQFYFR